MNETKAGLIRVLDASAEKEQLRRVLDAFEREHGGLPSERLIEAFTVDGVLNETDEFHSWSRAYATWLTLAG